MVEQDSAVSEIGLGAILLDMAFLHCHGSVFSISHNGDL